GAQDLEVGTDRLRINVRWFSVDHPQGGGGIRDETPMRHGFAQTRNSRFRSGVARANRTRRSAGRCDSSERQNACPDEFHFEWREPDAAVNTPSPINALAVM